MIRPAKHKHRRREFLKPCRNSQILAVQNYAYFFQQIVCIISQALKVVEGCVRALLNLKNRNNRVFPGMSFNPRSISGFASRECWRLSKEVALPGLLGFSTNLGLCCVELEVSRGEKRRGMLGISLRSLRVILMQ